MAATAPAPPRCVSRRSGGARRGGRPELVPASRGSSPRTGRRVRDAGPSCGRSGIPSTVGVNLGLRSLHAQGHPVSARLFQTATGFIRRFIFRDSRRSTAPDREHRQ